MSGFLEQGTHAAEEHHTGYAVHIKVWAALIGLTVLTVWAAGHPWGSWNTAVAMGIATLKAGLVMSIFMHLKYEGILFRGMVLVAFVTLAIIFGLTFSDYSFR